MRQSKGVASDQPQVQIFPRSVENGAWEAMQEHSWDELRGPANVSSVLSNSNGKISSLHHEKHMQESTLSLLVLLRVWFSFLRQGDALFYGDFYVLPNNCKLL